MNRTSESSSSQHIASSRSAESRRAVFKILSDTLRPPPSNVDQQTWSMGRSGFPKINKKSPRGLGGSQTARTSFPSLYSKAESGSRFPFFRDTTQKEKSSSRANYRNKCNRGGGEGSNMENSFQTQSQSSPSIPISKNCHLSNVLRSAKRSLQELRRAKDSLSHLVAEDEQLARGLKKSNPSESHLQLSQVALNITNLCREAFVPAHRLNQTALALYSAEDFLRYPSDIRTFDLHTTTAGRIKLPDMSFNAATVIKLRQVVDFAAETYNKFHARGRFGEELQEILFSMLRGYQDFYAATLGCQEIFKVLLYTGTKDKAHLQQFLLALTSMDRSDLLVEIQDLRRILDEIVIFLEKMSWGSFLIYRLAGGENAGAVSSTAGDAQSNGGLPTYPAYPLLRAKGPPKKKSPITEDLIEPCGVKLSMRPPPANLSEFEINGGATRKSRSKLSRKSTLDGEVPRGINEDLLIGDSFPMTTTQFSKKKGDASANSSKTDNSFSGFDLQDDKKRSMKHDGK